MITNVCQRWTGGRASYRPAGEPINTRLYEVAAIDGEGADNICKAFVAEHHYSGSMGAAKQRVGLYRGGTLVGVVVYTQPARNEVLDCLPCPRSEAAELGRLVLLQDVPANGESWFIARSFEIISARGYTGIVSFADPVERSTVAGVLVKPGHIGGIYQASNAVYAGLATARTLRLLPDGKVFSDRSRSKIRKRERGWHYSVEQLVAAGAESPTSTDVASLAAWLKRAVEMVTRKLKHTGNHRYLFGLTGAVKRHLPKSLPYPKLNMGQQALVHAA